jgi:uncharacterized protein (TIGR01244 family)
MYRIDESVSVGGQPDERDLPSLRRQGYRSVVNFRADGEVNDQWPPSEEGAEVEILGLKYFHLPTTMHTLTTEVVDCFRAAYPNLPRPVYAHCATGKRAAAMVLAQLACQRHLTSDQVEDAANRFGLRDRRDLIQFVQNYIDTHCRSNT